MQSFLDAVAVVVAVLGLMMAAGSVANVMLPRCPVGYPAIMSGDYVRLGGC